MLRFYKKPDKYGFQWEDFDKELEVEIYIFILGTHLCLILGVLFAWFICSILFKV